MSVFLHKNGTKLTLFLFYKNIFIRTLRLKFAKPKEQFKNKSEAEIVNRMQFRALKSCKINTKICFYLTV